MSIEENSSPSINTCPWIRADAEKAFRDLEQCDPGGLWGTGKVRLRGDVDGMTTDLFIRPDAATAASSGFFHWAARQQAHYIHKQSPADVINAFSKVLVERPDAEQRKFVRAMTYTAGQFNPGIAKAIMREVKATRVFDPCAGWGDRLAAALASHDVIEYMGVDPNTSLAAGYVEQVAMAGRDGFRVVTDAVEDVRGIPEGHFDLAFTSPPYFDTEIYSADEKQSCNRYPSREKWVPGFLVPMLVAAVKAVRQGGHIVINVADNDRGGAGPRRVSLCRLVMDVMYDLTGTDPLWVWGLRLTHRPYSTTAWCEPILVWRK